MCFVFFLPFPSTPPSPSIPHTFLGGPRATCCGGWSCLWGESVGGTPHTYPPAHTAHTHTHTHTHVAPALAGVILCFLSLSLSLSVLSITSATELGRGVLWSAHSRIAFHPHPHTPIGCALLQEGGGWGGGGAPPLLSGCKGQPCPATPHTSSHLTKRERERRKTTPTKKEKKERKKERKQKQQHHNTPSFFVWCAFDIFIFVLYRDFLSLSLSLFSYSFATSASAPPPPSLSRFAFARLLHGFRGLDPPITPHYFFFAPRTPPHPHSFSASTAGVPLLLWRLIRSPPRE